MKNASWTASAAWSWSGTIRADEPVELVLVAQDEVVEGGQVACLGPLDKDEVAPLWSVIGSRSRSKVPHDRRAPPERDGKAGRV